MTNIISISIAVFSLLLTIYWRHREWVKFNETTNNYIYEIIRQSLLLNREILKFNEDFAKNKGEDDSYSTNTFWLARLVSKRHDMNKLGSLIDSFNLYNNKYAFETNEIFTMYNEFINSMMYIDNLVHKITMIGGRSTNEISDIYENDFPNIYEEFFNSKYDDNLANINKLIIHKSDAEQKFIMRPFIEKWVLRSKKDQ